MLPDLTVHGQGHRRRAARRGLRRPARADGAHRAGRRRLPGGHAVRATRSPSPPAWPRCGCSTRPPTLRLAAHDATRWPTGCARPPGDRPVHGRRRARACSPSSSRAEPVARLRRRRRRCDLDAYGAWCRGAARPRRLPAAVAVRGLVPLARAHAEHVERTRRRRRRGVRGGRLSRGALAARARRRCAREGGLLADAAGRLRRRRRRRAAAPPRRPARARAAARPTYALLVEAIREGYLLHYGAPRAVRRRRPRPRAAGRRPALRARASRAWRRSATSRRSRELADVIALCAQAHAEGARELADAVWEAGAAAVGWGSSAAATPRRPRGARRRSLARPTPSERHRASSPVRRLIGR